MSADPKIELQNQGINTWSGYVNVTDVVSGNCTTNAYEPKIALDAQSNVHIIWYDSTDIYGAGSGDVDIFYRFWNVSSSTWSGQMNATDVVSNASSSDSYDPCISVDEDANVHVAWRDQTDIFGAGTDWDIHYRFWNASAGVWSGKVNSTDIISSESSSSSLSPTLAVDENGNVHIAWYDYELIHGAGGTRNIHYRFWNETSKTWSGYVNTTDIISSNNTGDAEYPSLDVYNGSVHVVWNEFTDIYGAGSDNDIFYKYWNATTKIWWGHSNAIDVISSESGSSSHYAIIKVDEGGIPHVVWEDEADIYDAGGDIDVHYRYWNPSTQTWKGKINATDIVSGENSQHSQNPQIDVDANGGIHVSWFDQTNIYGAGNDIDVFYRLWDASTNAWTGFVNLMDVISTEGNVNSHFPSIAVNGSGYIHIAWQDQADINGAGSTYDIFYKNYFKVATSSGPGSAPIPGFEFVFISIGLISLTMFYLVKKKQVKS